MRRFVACLIALIILLSCFSSCAGRTVKDKPFVVCTSFVQYDWARQIIGNCQGVELTLLVKDGKDMHSYSPSVSDMMNILESDLLIYTGGVSEAWVEEFVKENSLQSSLSLLDCLGEGVKHVEYSQGEAHDHTQQGHSEHTELHSHGQIDEHIWLSLKNATLFCERIKDGLCRVDKANAEIYKKNCEAYITRLEALDNEYANLVNGSQQKTVVVADRYPYRYLFDDYGITCYAAFLGCSSDSEVGFSTVIFLAEKMDSLGLGGIVITETSDGKLARTVSENTKNKQAKIYTLHSLQSVANPESESYLEGMRRNLDVLSALFCS